MKNFLITALLVLGFSAEVQAEKLQYTLEQAQELMSKKRESLVRSWNAYNSMSDEKFSKEVESIAKYLEKNGYTDRAAEMRTLADPQMKKLALKATDSISKDLEKNTLYLWVAMAAGNFCPYRLDADEMTARCMMDILLAVITLGDVSLDGAGEI